MAILYYNISMQEFSWKTNKKTRVRGVDWYWAIGLITIVGALGAIVLGNMLFGIFILIWKKTKTKI